MAFNIEDVIPEGYIKETTYDGGVVVHTYRNPNPDPVKQQEAIDEIAAILFKGYIRSLLRKQEEGTLSSEEKLILQAQV